MLLDQGHRLLWWVWMFPDGVAVRVRLRLRHVRVRPTTLQRDGLRLGKPQPGGAFAVLLNNGNESTMLVGGFG